MTKSRQERILEAYDAALKVGPDSEIAELMPVIEASVPDVSDTKSLVHSGWQQFVRAKKPTNWSNTQPNPQKSWCEG
jgi:hypothetical protein